MTKSMPKAPHAGVCVESLESRELFSLSFQFDYRYDATGFFSSQARKDVLNAAAKSVSSRLSDYFTAVTPSGGNTWSINLTKPATGTSDTITNASIAANTILVFVGARDLSGSTLGQGGPTGWSASGTTDWLATVRGRGQSGATATPRTDYAPKAGAIAFDSLTNWFFGTTVGGIGGTQSDFYSVAAHELGHVLGIGTGSDTWPALIKNNAFTGPKSEALYGGPVPVVSDGGHFADGTKINGQEVAMDPTLKQGTRKPYTELDFAALDDIGYTVTAAPTTPTTTTGTGSITGTSFWDVDRDGKRSPSEYGYNGRVYLDLNKNGAWESTEPSVITTDTNKYAYTFSGLKAGTYRVRESIPNGYFKPGVPGSGYYDVTVTADKTTTVPAFANVKTTSASTGDIIGTLFNDADSDGVQDSGETVLGGWRVFFDNNKNGVWDSSEVSTLTDAYGKYIMTAAPGTYRFSAVAQSGYRRSLPTSGYYDVTVSKGSLAVKNYGFTQKVLLSGSVFNDANGNGVRDSGETGLSGWKIYIDKDKDGVFDSAESYVTTDGNGYWQFKAQAAGAFVIRAVQQSGYTLKSPTAKSYTFTLTNGQTKGSLNFAEKKV